MAAGLFQKPVVLAHDLSSTGIKPMYSSAYRNPETLRKGVVLAVGGSGVQIADESNCSGRCAFFQERRIDSVLAPFFRG
ncbi:hypothetical protein NAC44_18000 [Allorhizobium sp. BGMRC 0089]|uniref:hypothetical protein n=1 Tax=Allorhizobium sonneratiae TaxID=2934936 RepID=UPI0020335AC5|nr:hypothetical protein [Allorhizobium sonneratiae]MCM2294223.1 hypothetical protein [Allorhizobium sonneratiae]